MPRTRRLDADGQPVPEGERRQLAVLFCDVVESTPLSQRMDAEEFGQVMFDFQELATETITGLGGHRRLRRRRRRSLVRLAGRARGRRALAVQAGLDILAGLDELNAGIEAQRAAPRRARRDSRGPVVVRTDRPDSPASARR